MHRWCTGVFLAVLVLLSEAANEDKPRFFDVSLDQEDKFHLYWDVYYDQKTVVLELHVKIEPIDWFAIGFSSYGQMTEADLCVCWVDENLKVRVQDMHTDKEGRMFRDRVDNCLVADLQRSSETTMIILRRKFDTCDDNDYIIEEGTVHVLYVLGKGPIPSITGKVVTEGTNYGFQRVQLLKNMNPIPSLPADAKNITIVHNNIKVPAEETTYWCSLHKLPDLPHKYHLIQYEAVIQEGHESLVHHMEVFRCEVPVTKELPDYNGPCESENKPAELKACKLVLAAWAIGAKPLVYPEEAGAPIGGPTFSRYVMLEVHFNNPELKDGVVDNSGIRLHYIPRLRKYDIGILELGLEYTSKMAIPPEQNAFSLTGYCIVQCTDVALPPFGITVFASQLHTHLTGKAVSTRHIRGGVELLELNRDDHYSPHFQEIRLLKRPVQIIPGDALITTCTYNTENRTNMTFGGFAITQEMCVNYIHYYPKSNLEVCKSSVSTTILSEYFKFMNKFEKQPTSESKGVIENYESIQWTPMRVQLLSDLYESAPISMQCNHSNGERFPGYWENAPQVRVLSPLPPPVRDCPGKH